ncbi:hypothetical protein [Rhodopseudomonas sp. BR0M22]|uniref:hypothetical protein n=1 Tax=Rhodopseudomonas sp. BR0M22 TaxID=2269369 RepID=UPI0013E060AF|nr:hypothetical protein [Rhodopseudomonas sp. BR0M22]
MAKLIKSNNESQPQGSHEAPPSRSPFFSRAYGGYTTNQQHFYLAHLGNPSNKTILDPMSGQGFLLANVAFEGATVWLGDINPTMGLMASLRSPEIVKSRHALVDWFTDKLSTVSFRKRHLRFEYVDDWLPEGIKVQLRQYRELFDLTDDPFHSPSDFARMSLRKRFAAAIPLLAAREIACYRSSDNHTWIKPGGLQRSSEINTSLQRAASSWLKFADDIAETYNNSKAWGRLTATPMDAARGDFGSSPRVDVVITSPPYANRLDYTRMWGPESHVSASIWGANIREIQSRQIGSNVVRGTPPLSIEEQGLPMEVVGALRAIKNDDGYASEGYYYPFFRNYAVTLAQSVRKLSERTKEGGLLVFFVRDTVRKDILFPTGLLIERVLENEGCTIFGKERKIVKRHVGLRRRAGTTGLYGIGQQEWWLAFRKGK